MTIEEKLTHFYDTSVEEARRQAEKDVQEHKDSLDAALEEHKKMSLENAASLLVNPFAAPLPCYG